MTNKEVKERYFAKKKLEAIEVECACGCGLKLLNIDDYGREVKFINGHNGRKYDDKWGYQKAWMNKNRDKIRGYKTKASRARKLELMKLFDNKCMECGLEYNGKNGSAFQFHHLDPSNKENNISSMLLNNSLDVIKKELEKCTMLCANCHMILHQGEF